jgi:type I restriction enzyme S subunit
VEKSIAVLLAKLINGATFKSGHFCEPLCGLPVVKIAEVKSGSTYQTKFSNRTDLDARYHIDTGEMLYSGSESPDTSLDTFRWNKRPGRLNQNMFRVVTESTSQIVCV